MAPLERRVVLGEQQSQDLDPFLEAVHALGSRGEGDAELAVLRVVPRGPHRALHASAGEVIDRDDLGGEHRGVPVGHARDERAEPHARGLAGEPREQRPRLERRAAGITVERLEVVEGPDAVEAGILGKPGARDELAPRELVLRDTSPQRIGRSGAPISAADRPLVEPATQPPAPMGLTLQALALAVPDAIGVLGPHRLAHRLVDLARIADHGPSICPG